MASSSDDLLHVVVFPWLAFGHLLPFLELSKSLARRGHRVSFISTPRNIERLPELPPQLSPLVHFIPFTFPRVEGLPEAAEATSDLPPEQVEYLKVAFDHLVKPFRKFILQESASSPNKPDWIIHDFAHHWLPQIAEEASVPTIFFNILTAKFLVFMGPAKELGVEGSRKKAEDLVAPPPWIPFPSKLCFRLYEARRFFGDSFLANVSGYTDLLRHKIALDKCTAVAVRSSMETEPEWLPLAPQVLGKPVLPVGLLPPTRRHEEAKRSRRSGEFDVVLEWLNKQRSRSVVYIAFGSEVTLSLELVHELALGVELAGLPFLWAFRGPSGVLPEGFEERTKNHGIVAKSWVPQLEILSHEAVGGFLTHAGCSSVVEGLHFGLPLIPLPIFLDQGLNARFLVEKGVAVEIERDEEDGSFTKEAVAAAARLVVVEEAGACYRSKARELQAIYADDDRQEMYVDDFLQYLREVTDATMRKAMA